MRSKSGCFTNVAGGGAEGADEAALAAAERRRPLLAPTAPCRRAIPRRDSLSYALAVSPSPHARRWSKLLRSCCCGGAGASGPDHRSWVPCNGDGPSIFRRPRQLSLASFCSVPPSVWLLRSRPGGRSVSATEPRAPVVFLTS